jgi:hypothetical protein
MISCVWLSEEDKGRRMRSDVDFLLPKREPQTQVPTTIRRRDCPSASMHQDPKHSVHDPRPADLQPPGIYNPPRASSAVAETWYIRGDHLAPYRPTFEPGSALPVKVRYENKKTGSSFEYEGWEGSHETIGAGEQLNRLVEKDAASIRNSLKERRELKAFIQENQKRIEAERKELEENKRWKCPICVVQ